MMEPAAHEAGAIAVGVATGKYTVEALRSAGADHVLATLEEPLPGVPGPETGTGEAHE